MESACGVSREGDDGSFWVLLRWFCSLTCVVLGITLRPRSCKILAYLTNQFAVASIAPASVMETSVFDSPDLSLLAANSLRADEVPNSPSYLARTGRSWLVEAVSTKEEQSARC
jgi:hypothetical protein